MDWKKFKEEREVYAHNEKVMEVERLYSSKDWAEEEMILKMDGYCMKIIKDAMGRAHYSFPKEEEEVYVGGDTLSLLIIAQFYLDNVE